MASVLLLFVALRDGTVTREDALMLWLGSMVLLVVCTAGKECDDFMVFPQCFLRGSQPRKFFWKRPPVLPGWGTLLVPEWFCMVLVVLVVPVWWFWRFRCGGFLFQKTWKLLFVNGCTVNGKLWSDNRQVETLLMGMPAGIVLPSYFINDDDDDDEDE